MSRILSPKVLISAVLIVGAMILSRILVPVPLPTIQMAPELVPIAGFHVPNTFIATVLSDITLILIAFVATRNMELVPGGVQNFVEWVIEAFYNLTEDVAGNRARQWFPIIMTIFLLVLVANWWELVPGVDSVGVVEPPHGDTANVMQKVGPVYLVTTETVAVSHEGEAAEEAAGHEEGLPTTEDGRPYGALVPFVRVSATDLNFTLALALVSMILVQFYGVRSLGLHYFSRFFNLNGGMDFFIGIIEAISEIARVISFAFRLFGNIFAGQVVLFIMPFLIPWLLPMPFFGLELFVGFIQAFVFAILTLVFFAGAVVSHDDAHI